MADFDVEWIDGGRPPQVAPNPAFPNGKTIYAPGSAQEPTCRLDLPYPPPHENIGQWHVKCRDCGVTMVITAASRQDDAKTVYVGCKRKKVEDQ
jgi:hypothetical protein